jgi:hypothetical protein
VNAKSVPKQITERGEAGITGGKALRRKGIRYLEKSNIL